MPKSTRSIGSNVAAFSESLISLGSEVRQVRKARGQTLKTLSASARISVSHLSAIERGTASPSLETIHRLADALGISSDWFFARRSGNGPMERAYVVRRQNRRNLNTLYDEGISTLGLSDELLSSSIGGSFFMGLATYEPHSERPGHPMYQHEGEQHGFILRGELQLQIGDEKIVLKEGDSYSFPTAIAHNARNVTDQPCQLIWSISPVTIPKDVVIPHAESSPRSRAAEPG